MNANEQARAAFYNAQPTGFLANIESHIDRALDAFVFNLYEALVTEYSLTILNLAVLYVIFYILAIYRGLIKASTDEMINAVLKLIIVTSVLYRFDDFLRFIFDALTIWPDQIITTIMSVTSKDPALSTVEYAKARMDLYFDQGLKLGMDIWEITGFGTKIYAILVWIAVFLMGAIPFGIFAVAKVTIALLLGLAPIFIVMILFGKTSGFFEAWVRNLASMVFLKIFAYAAMMLYLFIAQFPMEELVKKAAEDQGLAFTDFAALFIVTYVMWRFYKHVGSVASSIGSGFVMQTSGIAKAAYDANPAQLAKSGYNSIKSGVGRIRGRFNG